MLRQSFIQNNQQTLGRKWFYSIQLVPNIPCQRFVLYWQQSIQYEIISILQDDLYTAHGTGNYSVCNISRATQVVVAILENCAWARNSFDGIWFIRNIETCTCALYYCCIVCRLQCCGMNLVFVGCCVRFTICDTETDEIYLENEIVFE